MRGTCGGRSGILGRSKWTSGEKFLWVLLKRHNVGRGIED
jgi:hypothetical protein